MAAPHASKRRLPVLQTPAEDDAPPRPPWQWAGFGALAIFVVWVPLALLATALVGRLGGLEEAPLARAALFGATLALAAAAGGYLVGRWGTRGVGLREALEAGGAASLAATLLAGASGGWLLAAAALPVTALLAVAPAWLAARLGLSRRRAATFS